MVVTAPVMGEVALGNPMEAGPTSVAMPSHLGLGDDVDGKYRAKTGAHACGSRTHAEPVAESRGRAVDEKLDDGSSLRSTSQCSFVTAPWKAAGAKA